MRFIETKPSGAAGESYELQVWEVVKEVFSEREGIAYWQYPLFLDFKNKYRKYKEPDILIVDREFGLIVIEVKGFFIKNIEEINGKKWKMSPDFYQSNINPYEQARRYLSILFNYCDRIDGINNQLSGKAIVALPSITQKEWKEKRFEGRPDIPPIIFKDDLTKKRLYKLVEKVAPLRDGSFLSNEQWELLFNVFSGLAKDYNKQYISLEYLQKTFQNSNLKEVIEILEKQLSRFDFEQEKISKVIPPGPQRIRGIAGSGKSVILCQRAAHIYLKNPEDKIALIFFTRSLYDWFRSQVDYWLRRFSNEEVTLEKASSQIDILHAWGASDEPGFYSQIRDKYGISKSYTPEESKEYKILQNKSNQQWINPPSLLGFNCRRFFNQLEEYSLDINPIYNAILIDEGQDLVVEEDYKIVDKQPIYWLAWSFLKPISHENPDLKRFYWTYDEAQSLDILTIPDYEETFGSELGAKLSGRYAGPIYKGGAHRSEVMRRCYRTPGEILTVAHALGMGLLRSQGIVREWAITKKNEWDRLGYEIKGDFREINSKVKLKRPMKNNGNPLSSKADSASSLIDFKTFSCKNDELEFLVQSLKEAITINQIKPARNLLVIPLGENIKQIQNIIASKLQAIKINTYLSGAKKLNDSSTNDNRSQFWWDEEESGLTISGVHRAKGNEAYWVFLVGLEQIAIEEKNRLLRNQLFVGMTRTKGWLTMTGVSSPNGGEYHLYEEIEKALQTPNEINFTLKYDDEI